jgi:signal transduction histidine kinase
MRLRAFILEHMPRILAEWDAFARTLETAEPMTALALRDHAKPILEAIAADMETIETPREQLEKSRGLDPVDVRSAASTHGTLRHVSGFSLIQLTAEYRALRATVLRLWLPEVTQFDAGVASDMVRFNETIDQALAESVLTFSEQGERTRDTFLAILGHDLRSPLAAISMTGDLLAKRPPGPEELQRIGIRLRRSASAMGIMVADLLEFARLQLGGLVPIKPAPVEMADICNGAIDDARAAHPSSEFTLDASGDLRCAADAARLQQVFSNLLNNAAYYGASGQPVRLVVAGTPDAVVVEVRNAGAVIPAASIKAIFEPMVQLNVDRARPSASIGLGLFIAREITHAHGGTIDVSSTEESGTVFSVRLPRSLSAQELGRIQRSAD